jgi:hypothetical protein
MNPSLMALIAKLKGQYKELSHHLYQIEKESNARSQQKLSIEQQLELMPGSSLIMNPHKEMHQLNIMMQKQGKRDELNLILKNNLQLSKLLKDKLYRVTNELTTLEKYVARK